MKKKILLTSALLSASLLFSCGGSGGGGEDTDRDGLSDGIDYENHNGKPDFIEDNKHNGKPDDIENNGENENEGNENNEHTTGKHYQGVACSQCHSPSTASRSEGKVLNIGGTIFKNLQASNGDVNNAATYHTVRITLQNNQSNPIVASQGRGSGNFWSNANIPAGTKFKVEVLDRNGNVVNSTNGFTHDNTRLDCNSCHTASGLNGAPGRIVNFNYYGTANNNTGSNTNIGNTNNNNNTNTGNQNNTGNTGTTNNNQNNTGSTTGNNQNTNAGNQNTGNQNNTGGTPPNTQTVSFANDVYPILKNNCQSCHGATSGSGNLRIANDALTTYNNLMNTTPAAGGSFIDTANPSTSLILMKGSGKTPHGGGNALKTQSNYDLILNWITQGAKNN